MERVQTPHVTFTLVFSSAFHLLFLILDWKAIVRIRRALYFLNQGKANQVCSGGREVKGRGNE